MKILLNSLASGELVVFILCPWEYKFFNHMDVTLEIVIHTDCKQQILKKKLKFEQILEPEIIQFFSFNFIKELAGLFVVSEIIKIKIQTSAYTEWNCVDILCRNAKFDIIEKKSYDKQEINKIFKSNRNWNCYKEDKFILQTNLTQDNVCLRNLISRTVREVSLFCHLMVYRSITYYITDNLFDLYLISKKFPILQTNYLTVEDKILLYVINHRYLKNIIIHETVHALLYQNFIHNENDNLVLWQIYCIEGYCQYVMDTLCMKKDAGIRFFTALEVLKISNVKEFREKVFCTVSGEQNSSLIQYEIMPYIFEEWEKIFNLEDLFLDFYNEKEIGNKIIECYSMIMKNNKDKETMDINELYSEIYARFFRQTAVVKDTEEYHCYISQYRQEIERLRYEDFSK